MCYQPGIVSRIIQFNTTLGIEYVLYSSISVSQFHKLVSIVIVALKRLQHERLQHSTTYKIQNGNQGAFIGFWALRTTFAYF